MAKGHSHVFSKIFLHVNWHCKSDLPQILPAVEKPLYSYIAKYCNKERGVHFMAIGGIPTHLHLLFQVEPYVDIADFIGKAKGASAHEMNALFGNDPISWQRGYGIVSFAEKDLALVKQYVEQQKERHSSSRINHTLESWQGEKV